MRKSNYVDPIIGTVGDEKATSLHGGGKTHPGACTPGGMVQLSPDTVTGGDNGTGYNYCQNTIEGFSFNHMSGIGWYGDLGNLQIMPIVGETDLRSGSNAEIPFTKGTTGWKSPFSHEKETAKAGYYAVELERYGIFAEATVSPHTGMLRLTYPDNNCAGLIFNISRRIAGHADYEWVEICSDTRIEGKIHCTPAGGGFGRGQGGIAYDLFFVCELSQPAKEFRFFSNEEYAEEGLRSFEGEDVGLLARFDTVSDQPLLVKCGISYTDPEGARKNLQAECDHFEFDRLHAEAEELWENAFRGVDVEGTDPIDLTLFYTCMYHALLDPRSALDVDGRFRSARGTLRHTADYTQRTVFSGWDVYRSEFPLLTLIYPEMVNDTVNSLLQIALEENSSFPKWELLGIDDHCMVGDPGLLVIADAYLKGIRGYDIEKVYAIARASCRAEDTLFNKPFHNVHPLTDAYKKDAFVAEKLSDTLEFLLADYVMYRLAEALGKEEDAKIFLARVKRYKENYNPATGFMGPRLADGSFLPMKNEYDTQGCVESNIFQQSWFVPYDVPGLAQLFGKERTVELLERFFSNADLTALWNEDYNHSNEPCHNITHYFNYLGLAHRTQYWTRRVQKEAYRLGAFGFCGNEDVGQLSGWYVLSALGFAQVCPGDDTIQLNTPLFRKATVALDGKYHACTVSDTLTIQCDQDPLEYPYIRAVRWNGVALEAPCISFAQLTAGGALEFELSKEPCPEFGGQEQAPARGI